MTINAQGTQFFHIFQAMRESGDVARMGPNAFTIYSMIKSYVGAQDASSFPSIETLIKDTGLSKSTVIRSIHKLIELEYIHKEMHGRNAVYKIQERIPLVDDQTGEVTALATWDYIPEYTVTALEKLKELLNNNTDGQGAKYIHIEHLQVVVSNLDNGSTQNIVNGAMTTVVPDKD